MKKLEKYYNREYSIKSYYVIKTALIIFVLGIMTINLLNYPDARDAGAVPGPGGTDLLDAKDVFGGTDLPVDLDGE